MQGALPMGDPPVIEGRMLGACRLRLERRGHVFRGAVSGDGSSWTSIGQVTVPLKKTVFVGLGVCSGLDKVTTLVTFDQVTVSPYMEILQGETPDGKVSLSLGMMDRFRSEFLE
jgi:hypothetical protein